MTYEDISRVNGEINMIDMKGKDYAMVPERVTAFRKLYPEGFIITEIAAMEGPVVVMKAKAGFYREDGSEVILGTGLAREERGKGLVNTTSHIENCVPLDTEILTDSGWKYYYQLSLDDSVLSLNMDTKQIEFCKIIRLNTYEKEPVLELKTSRFCVRCTDQHRWIVRSQYEDISKEETRYLRKTQKIVQNVKQDYLESDDGRKLGWLMCDCDIKRTENGMPSTAYISQSKHIQDIAELFGEGKLRKKTDEELMDNYEWIVPALEVRRILGKFGISDYSDLGMAMLKAEINDVAGCYRSMMLADGEKRGFSSTYPELVEAVQIMCARLGIATGHIKSRTMRLSTKPIYTLAIKKTDGAWVSEIKVSHLPPQNVWCPTTANGTWFMRQGDFVTLTSNCETSAVGRALGFMGLGINGGGICSAEELANAVTAQKQMKEDFEQQKKDIEAAKLAELEKPKKAKKDAPAKVETIDELPW